MDCYPPILLISFRPFAPIVTVWIFTPCLNTSFNTRNLLSLLHPYEMGAGAKYISWARCKVLGGNRRLLHPRFGAEFRIEGVIIDFSGSIPYRGMGGKNEDGVGTEE